VNCESVIGPVLDERRRVETVTAMYGPWGGWVSVEFGRGKVCKALPLYRAQARDV
jgi:hypothetical protein